MPGVNAPNEAGVPSDSDSVAGTVPLAVPPVDVAPSRTPIQSFSSWALARTFAREAASPLAGFCASARSASMSLSDEL